MEIKRENVMIQDIIESSDLLELADKVDHFLQYIQSESKQKTLIHKLEQEINTSQSFFRLMDDENNPYQILNGKSVIIQYLYNILPYGFREKESLVSIRNNINHIRATIENPQGKRLCEKDIRKIMAHLENRFKYCSRVLKSDHLRISLLNNSFKTMNSIYTSKILTNDVIIHSIFLAHEKKSFGHPQEYTLLHELGHALHTEITRKQATLPESFRSVQELMFRKSLDFPPIQVVEIFADCFTCVASLGTELEKNNPLNAIHPDDKALLVKYFDYLMVELDKTSA